MSLADKLTEVAENVPKVYEAGKQAEYDAFWNAVQQNGNRRDYQYAFMRASWTDDTFNPKYDLKPTNATAMFSTTYVTDLESILKRNGIVLDTTECTSLNQAFFSSSLTVLPEIVFTQKATSVSQAFAYSAKIHTIRKLTFEEGFSMDPHQNNLFLNCHALAHVEFSGVLEKSINFQYSPLTLESAKSLINILKDFSGTSTAGTKTVTFSSTTKNLLDAAGAIFNNMSWDVYLDSIGWTY